MDNAKAYVETRLSRELEDFQRRGIGQEVTELSVYEKVLIYKYSLDGYEGLNEALRSGRAHPMERLLNEALDKLPDYEDVVYRGTVLTKSAKEKYRQLGQEGGIFEEPGFLSTSRSEKVAGSFSRGDVIFEIASFSGKNIENLSFHGSSSPANEREVLFKSKSKFQVLEYRELKGRTSIKLIQTL